MKIKFNESENSIEIKDGLKIQYLVIKILVILNLVNAIIRIFGKNINEYGFIEYLWIAIGIVSIVVLYFFLLKKSAAEKINVEKIKRFREKSVFGRKRFTLELINGRNRDLGNFNNEFELAKVRELLANIGIATD